MTSAIKKWFLSPHAAERMQERNISVAELEKVLTLPDEVIKQGPKWIYVKMIKHRKDNLLAAVVLEKKEGLWLVITLMVNFQKK